ncbi:hypothetical protein ACFQ0B_22520 [Nonomuraea thailandensis]
MLEAIHASALYLAPVRDASGRVVDFLILAANRHARTAAGRTAAEVAGRRLMAVSPGVAGSGLLDDYISAFETGEPVHREGLEFVEVLDYLLWPATLNVRAARVDDGLLVSWRPWTTRSCSSPAGSALSAWPSWAGASGTWPRSARCGRPRCMRCSAATGTTARCRWRTCRPWSCRRTCRSWRT